MTAVLVIQESGLVQEVSLMTPTLEETLPLLVLTIETTTPRPWVTFWCSKTVLTLKLKKPVGEYSKLIKTITKFSNVIGYQQPDLIINWTVAHVMLVIGQYEPFFARCSGALC